jgi:transcription elongation factor Elf1
MMATLDREINQPEVKKNYQITFKCRFCGETKPLGEMVQMTRFFPPVVACADCEKKMDRIGG